MFSQGWEFTTLNITQKFWNKHSDELQKLLSLLKFENWSMHYQQMILNVTTVNLKRLTFCFLLVSWNQLKYLRVWGLYSPNYGGNCCCRQNHHRRDLIRRRSKLPWSINFWAFGKVPWVSVVFSLFPSFQSRRKRWICFPKFVFPLKAVSPEMESSRPGRCAFQTLLLHLSRCKPTRRLLRQISLHSLIFSLKPQL